MNKKEYPYNLIADVFALDRNDKWKECNIPEDLEKTTEFILENVLISQRNKEIIYARYKDNMTYIEIGEKFEISPQLAMKMIHKFLRQFRCDYWKNVHNNNKAIPYPYNLIRAIFTEDEWKNLFCV